ncbi:MAG: hypothetical protein KatS3mg129_0551 [Leptospiraceae bacterium]|nr:MAG: hypothetical protein KatS3mg129_0551 [Leptospiraceae bacterium]
MNTNYQSSNDMKSLWSKKKENNQISLIKKIYEVLFILIALTNFIIVLFDALYLYKLPYYHCTLRDVLLHHYPENFKKYFDPIKVWDPIKGIEPHRFTVSYLENYQKLKQSYEKLIGTSPVERIQIKKEIDKQLQILIELSEDMIDRRSVDSHFYLANKDGVLEKIKNIMRQYKPNPENSAKQAFRDFFSIENLNPDNDKWQKEFAFFDREIIPLMKENYFRWIGEDGEPKDNFYKIDRWFVLFFILDFLGRWFANRKRYKKWYLFPIHHFYEIFNLYPPHHSAVFRLLRIIPLYIRLKENRFIPDDGIMPEIIHENAKIIADEISGLVLVNIIEQTKNRLKEQGKLDLEPQTIDALETILKKQMDIFSNKIMPELEPMITEMVHYSINRAAEPFLLSPIGPLVRIILYNIHATVREGLEAAFNSPEGLERLNKILHSSVEKILENMTASENQEMLIKDITNFLEILKEDIANNYIKES